MPGPTASAPALELPLCTSWARPNFRSTRKFTAVLDSALHTVSDFTAAGGGAHAHEFNVLFGPQVSAGGERLRLFGHGLLGIAHTNIEPGPSDTGAGWVLGGGADYALNDQLAWRVAQLDYHGSHLFGNTKKDFRFSTGILFRFR